MKILLICLLFAPIVYLAIKHKRWYLYLAVAFIGILPEQFSFSIHDDLPLISVTRLLIVLLGIFWAMERIKSKNFSVSKALLIFGGVNIIVSLINLRYGFGEINRIFLYIFERIFLVILLKDLIHTKEEFHRCVDFMIMGCCALAVIGIVQTLFSYDISSVLHLQKTATSIKLSTRMGMIRAFGTFNAISYGCYCAFMVLPIYFRLEQTGKLRYSLAFALNFMALICTFTRSAWLCIAAVFGLLILLRYKVFFKKILPAVAFSLALCCLMCLAQPKFFGGLAETGKSAANTLLSALPDSFFPTETPKETQGDTPTDETTVTEETEPTEPTEPTEKDPPKFDISEDFGANVNPTASRMMQWTAVQDLANQGQILFGHGYNALLRGKIRFYFKNWGSKWVTTTFLDVGLVALIMEGGIVGTISYLALLGYMVLCSLKKRNRSGELDFYKLTVFMVPLYLLLNFLAAFLFYPAVWLYIAAFFAYQKLNGDEQEFTLPKKT